MRKYDIVVAGHICLDICPALACRDYTSVSQLFRPGRLINLDGVVISSGGPVSNTGFAMARLGLDVLPIASIGDDWFGALLCQIAKDETGRGLIQKNGIATSYSVILSPPGIDRIILHDPAGNNCFTAGDIDYDAVAHAACFHFGYPPLMRSVYQNGGDELRRIYALAKETGTITSLDMSLPDDTSESGRINWPKLLQKTLPFVDLFMPSVEEALYMLDRPEYERIMSLSTQQDFTQFIDFARIRRLAQTILDMGTKICVIKCGAHGIYIRTTDPQRMPAALKENWANREIFHATYCVDAFKSALGGGDTTIAGFLAGLIRGYNIEDCARIACKTGALCCTTYDAISGIRPVEEVAALTGNPLNATALPLGYLHYNQNERLYSQ